MIDTAALKSHAPDLLSLVSPLVDTRKAASQNGGEWSGPCPFCGGKDRFSVQPYHDEPRWLCRHCTDGVWKDIIEFVMRRDGGTFEDACRSIGWNGAETDPQKYNELSDQRRIAQEAEEAQRSAQLDAKLAEYSTAEIWRAYQRRMEGEQITWWENQGIPSDWQQYLRLGYTDSKKYKDRAGVLQNSPAYTIPYFHKDFDFRSLQYRLTAPGISDRYRFEYGLKSTYYMVTPGEPMYDQVVICEGAKKAIVANLRSNLSTTTFLAVPSKTDYGGVVSAVQDCGAVYIVLDPDAWTKPVNASDSWVPSPIKLARLIGEAARVVDLPGKIDDLYLENSLHRNDFLRLLMTSRRVVK